MWRRSESLDPGSSTTLDAEITALRQRVRLPADDASLGRLVSLLLARGLVGTREDRDDEALADYREAAELLLAAEPGPCPVSDDSARTLWMALAASERRRGSLDTALEAARRAVALRRGLPADSIQLFAGFYADLKDLTTDLEKAGRPEDRVVGAELAVAWSRALCEVDRARFAPTIGITGAVLAKALGDAGRLDEALDCAAETLPVLRSCGLGAIELGVLLPRGAWLRSLGRWEEAVDNEREALAVIRGRSTREAVVEVHLLRMLARSLVGAGRGLEARPVLEEALSVAQAPGPGVVPLRDTQLDRIRAGIHDEMASLDSMT